MSATRWSVCGRPAWTAARGPTPATETAPDAQAYLEETIQQSLYSDFVTGLRETAGVTVNQQTLNQLLALDTAGQ